MLSQISNVTNQARFFASALRPTASRKPAWSGAPLESVTVKNFTQDRTKLAAYQDLCNFTRSDIVPATWLHVQTFALQTQIMAGRDWPFPVLGTVHVANQMRQLRPVRVDEELTLCVQVGQLYPHAKGTIVTMNGTILVGRELVWAGRSDYLVPGYEVPGQQQQVEREEVPATSPSVTANLPADLGRKYARVSGDYNPIHLSAASAKLFGFPSAIVHGMWTHAWALGCQEKHLPDAYETRVQFTKPVALPSTVSFVRDDDRFGVLNSAGKPHLTGHVRRLEEKEHGKVS